MPPGSAVTQLPGLFPAASELLLEAEDDLLAFSTFPVEHWRQLWSKHDQEPLDTELRRRTDVVATFPNRPALIRLCDAELAEAHGDGARQSDLSEARPRWSAR